MATDRMYELAFSFKNRKLWKELSDTELFGVLLADGEIGYCSVMGMLGEHPSLGVYIGQSGYAGFCRMLSPAFSPESADAAEILAAQDCLRCSFENGEMLSEQEIREVRTYCRKTKKTLSVDRSNDVLDTLISLRDQLVDLKRHLDAAIV